MSIKLNQIRSIHLHRLKHSDGSYAVNRPYLEHICGFNDLGTQDYFGQTEYEILKKIETLLTDEDKQMLVYYLNNYLEQYMAARVLSLPNFGNDSVPSGKFIITTSDLFACVVKKALEDTNLVSDPGLVFCHRNYWCLWVCIFMLVKAGWEVIETPRCLYEEVVDGQTKINFTVKNFDYLTLDLLDKSKVSKLIFKPISLVEISEEQAQKEYQEQITQPKSNVIAPKYDESGTIISEEPALVKGDSPGD